MDRSLKEALGRTRLAQLADDGAASARGHARYRSSPRQLAERVVLMGEGEVIAADPVAEVLSGGWYFATDVRARARLEEAGHSRPSRALNAA